MDGKKCYNLSMDGKQVKSLTIDGKLLTFGTAAFTLSIPGDAVNQPFNQSVISDGITFNIKGVLRNTMGLSEDDYRGPTTGAGYKYKGLAYHWLAIRNNWNISSDAGSGIQTGGDAYGQFMQLIITGGNDAQKEALAKKFTVTYRIARSFLPNYTTGYTADRYIRDVVDRASSTTAWQGKTTTVNIGTAWTALGRNSNVSWRQNGWAEYYQRANMEGYIYNRKSSAGVYQHYAATIISDIGGDQGVAVVVDKPVLKFTP